MRFPVLVLLAACDVVGPAPLTEGAGGPTDATGDPGDATWSAGLDMGGWAAPDDTPDHLPQGDGGSTGGGGVECPDPGLDADGDGFGVNAECDDGDPL